MMKYKYKFDKKSPQIIRVHKHYFCFSHLYPVLNNPNVCLKRYRVTKKMKIIKNKK